MLEENCRLRLVLSFSLLSLDSENLKDEPIFSLDKMLFKNEPILLDDLLEASANIWIRENLLVWVLE